MKTISDATGIAGKRGVRIPIPRQPEVPGLTPARASGPHAPRGRENFAWNTTNCVRCFFRTAVCVLFFGAFESNENILLNDQEIVSYLIEARKVNLLTKRHGVDRDQGQGHEGANETVRREMLRARRHEQRAIEWPLRCELGRLVRRRCGGVFSLNPGLL
jgi:hypothetical protein